MGWTTFHFTGTKKEFVYNEFGRDPEWGTIIDVAVIGSVIYAALKYGSKHGKDEGKVTALIILTSSNKRDYYNFGYKDMDESCGPHDYKCPKRIISLLSPLNELFEEDSNSYRWAKGWREKCLEKKPAVKIEIGQVAKFKEPVKLNSGLTFEYFKYLAKNLWGTLTHPNDERYGILVRFRKSRFTFEIIK